MLKGLDAYGSDESDTESPIQTRSKSATERKPSTSTSLLSLPPPVNSAKPRPRRAVFTIAKPTKSPTLDEEEQEQRPAKKPKIESKNPAGTSSLLAMLPAPSKPIAPVPSKALDVRSGAAINLGPLDDTPAESEAVDNDTPSIPIQSILKSNKKTKGNSSQTGIDFFSLGSTHTSAKRTLPTSTSSSGSSILASVSSAPAVPTFEPPEPTPRDPYPGYYQLPSGKWAAYDPDYYMKYYNSWTADDRQADKNLNEAEYENAVQIDVQAQLDLARKEQEDRKALTKDAGGGPSAPRMNIKAAKAGSLARTRHQLSTLLTDAYENREALEERIAQAKRNRKESGNKYGF